MQRQVTLEGHARNHPFRNHVRRAAARERKMRDDGDMKLFVLSFSAFFVCFTTFLL